MITNTLSLKRWEGAVAVVTGASAGCGAAIAKVLVQNGFKVAGLARRREKVAELARELSQLPGRLYAIKCDITNEAEILSAFKQINDVIGVPRILINNAGISQPTTLSDGDVKMWKKILDTNVMGLAICTKEAIKYIRKSKKEGHIVHINSVLGHYVAHVPKINMYAASKFAVTAMTETLRQEIMANDDDIRITSISPGPIESDFVVANNLFEESKEFEEYFSKTPKILPEDVADAVVYVMATPIGVMVQELTIRPQVEKV